MSKILDYARFYKNNGYWKTPKTIQVEVTKECPLNCPQCYKNLEGPQNMSMKTLDNILMQLKDLGPCAIMINGGEPLTYPLLPQLLEFVSYNNLQGYIYTSGFGIDKIPLELLRSTHIHLDISLNGSTKNINNLSRDGFEISLNAMDYLKASQIPFTYICLLR